MLQHFEINPVVCDAFRREMQRANWELTHQDVGQTEMVGYGYVIIWKKIEDKVVLHYNDRMGVAQAQLEVTKPAFADVKAIVDALESAITKS
ncbi:hypothetical protein [Thiomicrorhabdus aquaedulcis]|jgi:hypothetical protein|uniref:hypothetical protein n=1 Tax=Thiomicrorhabdus aquaedulcis TaxID=2211106 RepID=UPI000FD7C71D|nr:hypothetical protein [Thiomicrorhabdus aquaedulcis]